MSEALQQRAVSILQGYGAERFVNQHFPNLALYWRNDVNNVFQTDPFGNDLRHLKAALCMAFADCNRVLKRVRAWQVSWRTEVFPSIWARRRRAEIRHLLMCLRRLDIYDHNVIRDEVFNALLVREQRKCISVP
jgi:hypothetical protein